MAEETEATPSQQEAEPDKSEQQAAPSKPEPITFAEFLQGVPPSTWRDVTHLWKEEHPHKMLVTPPLQLHCSTEDLCERISTFRSQQDVYFSRSANSSVVLNCFLDYRCSNCLKMTKRFSLQVIRGEQYVGKCYKYGESPPFGTPTPPRLQRLFQSDRLLFLKGRQCENHGLGIGAFVYYRRVVENHKNDILDAIIRVVRTVSAPPQMIETLTAAKSENQFTKAMESVKDAIPDVLLINGANPITLLHSALSLGLHAQTDEQCLARAHDVRLVLIELSERLSQVLKDNVELNSAVTRLLQLRQATDSQGSVSPEGED
jgi:hypothetical protein